MTFNSLPLVYTVELKLICVSFFSFRWKKCDDNQLYWWSWWAAGLRGSSPHDTDPLSSPEVSVPEADVAEDCATGSDLFYLQHFQKKMGRRLVYLIPKVPPLSGKGTAAPPCQDSSPVPSEARSPLKLAHRPADAGLSQTGGRAYVGVAVEFSVMCLINIMYFNCIPSQLRDSKWKISSWLILAF